MMQRYDIESDWDDPYDRPEERRTTVRFNTSLKIMIALESGSARRKLVGPGIVENLSDGGLCCVTKHQLVPGNDLTLRFATDMCPAEMCMPKSFYGPAKVVRVTAREGDLITAGIEFGDALRHSMEFAMYVQYLESAALMH